MQRAGSTFAILIPILFLGIVGLVTLPAALCRIRVHEEVAAVHARRRVGVAEYRHRARTGRFGFLPDLLRPGPDGARSLEFDLRADPATGIARVGPYALAVLLPDEGGRPVDFPRSPRVSPRLARTAFRAVAWPVEAAPDPRQVYVLGTDLVMIERPADRESLRAPVPPPLGRIPLLPPPAPGRDAALPPPWRYTLRRETAAWFRRRFAALGLPPPPDLRATPRRPGAGR